MEYNSPIICQYDLWDPTLRIEDSNSSGFIDFLSNLILLVFFISKSFVLTNNIKNIAHGINNAT